MEMKMNDPECRSPKTDKCGIEVPKMEKYNSVLMAEWINNDLTIYFLFLVAFQNKKIN